MCNFPIMLFGKKTCKYWLHKHLYHSQSTYISLLFRYCFVYFNLWPTCLDGLRGDETGWNERLPGIGTRIVSDHTRIVSDYEQLRSHAISDRQCPRPDLQLLRQRGGWSQQIDAHNQRLQQRQRDRKINGIIDVHPKPRDSAANLRQSSKNQRTAEPQQWTLLELQNF